jgi:hypothetical protein
MPALLGEENDARSYPDHGLEEVAAHRKGKAKRYFT